MANGGYTGALPARDDSPEAYSGVWESQEQYAELAAGRWAQQATGLAPRSVRFNSADSARFTRTVSTASNRKTWTWSGWVKRTALGSNQLLFGSSTLWTELFFNSSDQLQVYAEGGSLPSGGIYLYSNAVFRDTSAWMHVVWVLDTTQPTAANRLRVYVNGQQITWTTSISFNQNLDFNVNSANVHGIGSRVAENNLYLNAYLASVYFIDGQALEPEAFGFFDGAGIWQPRQYRGTYGTNGFYLDFSDPSIASATALGADRSGNNNNWLPIGPLTSTSTIRYSNGLTSSQSPWPGSATQQPFMAFDGHNLDDYDRVAYAGVGETATWQASSVPITAPYVGTLTLYGYRNSASESVEIYVNGSLRTPTVVYTPPVLAYGIYGFQITVNAVVNSFSFRNSGGGSTRLKRVMFDSTVLLDAMGKEQDSLLDSPVNGRQSDTGLGGEVQGNYATLNPLNKGSNATLTNGNLDYSSSAAYSSAFSTIGMTSGKWYFEATAGVFGNDFVLGLSKDLAGSTYVGGTAQSWGYEAAIGAKYNGTVYATSGYSSYTTGDVISVAFDADNGKLFFAKNGVWQESGNPVTGANPAYTGLTSGPYFFGCSAGASGTWLGINFGQRPWFYQAPAGFKALCTANLPEPAIKRGDDYFQTLLYTGNGSTQTLSNLRFSPDLVWMKARNIAYFHRLVDSVRGVQKFLYSNSTALEATSTLNDRFNSFDPTGFTLGAADDPAGDGINQNGLPYVAWTWDAGSSTVTNTQGSITSTVSVRANPSAGFSIVGYSGASGGGSWGHGLNAEPIFIIFKRRNAAQNWFVFHKTSGSWRVFEGLNNTNADNSYSGSMSASSTVVSLPSIAEFTTDPSSNYIAYCFAPVNSYSAFGAYQGNGSADGPFVFTGMRPRWIMFKCSSTNNGYTFWEIIDTARPNNLAADLSDAEGSYNLGTGLGVDILSNGFKIRGAGSGKNLSGQTYVYAAFAEHPFRSARAR